MSAVRMRGGKRLRVDEMLPGQYEQLMRSLDEIAAEKLPETKPLPVVRPSVLGGVLRLLAVVFIFLGGLVGILGALTAPATYNGVTVVAVLLVLAGGGLGWFGLRDGRR